MSETEGTVKMPHRPAHTNLPETQARLLQDIYRAGEAAFNAHLRTLEALVTGGYVGKAQGRTRYTWQYFCTQKGAAYCQAHPPAKAEEPGP